MFNIKTVFLGVICIMTVLTLSSCKFDTKINYKNYSKTFEQDEFTQINTYIAWGNVNIIPSNNNNLLIDGQNVPNSFSTHVENQTLTIDYNYGFKSSLFNNKNTIITIKVPNKKYDKIKLNLGACNVNIKELQCNDINVVYGSGSLNIDTLKCLNSEIESGAGNLDITNFEVENDTTIKGGVGNINISKSVLGGLKLDQGVGSFNFLGTINGDINVNGGVGSFTLNLENPESDFDSINGKYSLNINKGIGNKNISYNN